MLKWLMVFGVAVLAIVIVFRVAPLRKAVVGNLAAAA